MTDFLCFIGLLVPIAIMLMLVATFFLWFVMILVGLAVTIKYGIDAFRS